MTPGFLSALGREDAEQRDDERDAQVRLDVGVRLRLAPAAVVLYCLLVQVRGGRVLHVEAAGHRRREGVARRVVLTAWIGRSQERMVVRRILADVDRHFLLPAGLGEQEPVALVYGHAAAQV